MLFNLLSISYNIYYNTLALWGDKYFSSHLVMGVEFETS